MPTTQILRIIQKILDKQGIPTTYSNGNTIYATHTQRPHPCLTITPHHHTTQTITIYLEPPNITIWRWQQTPPQTKKSGFSHRVFIPLVIPLAHPQLLNKILALCKQQTKQSSK